MQNQTLKEYESNLGLRVISLDDIVYSIISSQPHNDTITFSNKKPELDSKKYGVFDSVYDEVVAKHQDIIHIDMELIDTQIEKAQKLEVSHYYDFNVICGGDMNRFNGVSLRD